MQKLWINRANNLAQSQNGACTNIVRDGSFSASWRTNGLCQVVSCVHSCPTGHAEYVKARHIVAISMASPIALDVAPTISSRQSQKGLAGATGVPSCLVSGARTGFSCWGLVFQPNTSMRSMLGGRASSSSALAISAWAIGPSGAPGGRLHPRMRRRRRRWSPRAAARTRSAS